MGWRDIVGDAGRIISIDHYGASAPGAFLFEQFGFSADTVVAAAQESLAAATKPGAVTAPVHAGPSGPQTTDDQSDDPGVSIS